MIVWRHGALLRPAERRRLAQLLVLSLVRFGRLSRSEHRELRALVVKLRLRLMFVAAAKRVSPIPLPDRLLAGPAGRAGAGRRWLGR